MAAFLPLTAISLRGLGRLAGVNYQTWGRGDNILASKIDEMLAAQGLEGDNIMTAQGLVRDQAVAVVLEYYAFTSKAANEQARHAYRQFATIGIRATLRVAKGLSAEVPFIIH